MGLFDPNILFDRAVEESRFDVHLLDIPVVGRSQGEDGLVAHGLHH